MKILQKNENSPENNEKFTEKTEIFTEQSWKFSLRSSANMSSWYSMLSRPPSCLMQITQSIWRETVTHSAKIYFWWDDQNECYFFSTSSASSILLIYCQEFLHNRRESSVYSAIAIDISSCTFRWCISVCK